MSCGGISLYYVIVLMTFALCGFTVTKCWHENSARAQYGTTQCDISLVRNYQYQCCEAQCDNNVCTRSNNPQCDTLCTDFTVLLVQSTADSNGFTNEVGVPCGPKRACRDHIHDLLTAQRVECYVRDNILAVTIPSPCARGRMVWGILFGITATVAAIWPSVRRHYDAYHQ